MRKVCSLCSQKAVLSTYPREGVCFIRFEETESLFLCPPEWSDKISLCRQCWTDFLSSHDKLLGGIPFYECPHCRKIHDFYSEMWRCKERIYLATEDGSFALQQEEYFQRWMQLSHHSERLDESLSLCSSCFFSLLEEGIIAPQ